MGELKINFQYPFHPDYEYVAKLERINLDEERIRDINTGNGFVISEPQSIKKDLKSFNSIYSTRFGQTLQDINPFADRYKCGCGALTARIHHGIKCPVCGERVKFVDDNYKYFGWICLKDPYYIIHPNLYKSIEFLVGADILKRILLVVDEKDENGFSMEIKNIPKGEPFYGLGIIDFKDKILEILQFYVNKNPNKKEFYDDIIRNKESIFIQSIPVYTTHLRPYSVSGENFNFEGTNSIYSLMAKLAYCINKDNLRMFRKKKSKNDLLFDLQGEYNKLYKEIEEILSQKKGQIRSLFGGRYNFTARSVIVPNPKLRIDEITLPYHALVELLQQRIINILQMSYNITYSEAYKIWYKAQIKKNDRVYEIIKYLIKDSGRGLPVIINRNPTIA